MKKTTKRYSQRMYLFVLYGTFILLLLVIFFVFTYHVHRKNTLENEINELENMCASIENSVEMQLNALATISLNIAYSNAIKANFKEFSAYCRQSSTDPRMMVSSREKAWAIHDIVTAVIGAYQSASDVRIYTMDGSVAGYWRLLSTIDLQELSWYGETMALNGHMYISDPETHRDLPARSGNPDTQKFISLVRLVLDTAGQPEGIVEVIQDCDVIFSLADQLEQRNPDRNVYTYNSRHKLVYPYNEEALPSINYDSLIWNRQLAKDSGQLVRTENGEMIVLTYCKIPDYQWTVVLTTPESSIYASFGDFRRMFIWIGAASILFTLLICFYISKGITAPLSKLTAAAGKITINRILDEKKVNLTSADSRIRELSILCESIRSMYEKLRSTSQEALLSRSEETRARLQATQSVINPHFLYNCLTNISIMAEEEMQEDIIQMCSALCDYFRYISSSGEMMVPLEKEIFYTERYLECMKMRYHEEFQYQFAVGKEALPVYIPKLLIQPIVENAFKYAFNRKPPWELFISASVQEGKWKLRIQDNQGTMTEEKKKELLWMYQHLDLGEELKSMQIGGMGLKNVYLRLKLLYQEQAVFKIDLSQAGKTVFVLGGPVYYSKEEYHEQHSGL
ncbi:histidine kinase [Enterocloster clostridioformis]|uniref:cache domain-containing sensor histidine kinase n=1 Tax=Enterocloster clostridioformis TaxID=1531 RepID=UPI002675B9E6|nr:sensor histidine kinase [Enterocloster clostridioformis]